MPIEVISRLGDITAVIQQTFEYTAGEVMTAKTPVCIGETDGRVYKAKADSTTTMPSIGITKDTAVTAGDTVLVYQFGLVTSVAREADFNKDDTIYVSPDTAGKVTSTPPSAVGQLVQILGRAINSSDIVLEIDPKILEIGT